MISGLKKGSRIGREAHAIVTSSGLDRSGKFDVLIRADGGCGDIPIPDEWRTRSGSDSQSLLIVDFDDRYHPVVRQRSRARRTSYEQAGCRDLKCPHRRIWIAFWPAVRR